MARTKHEDKALKNILQGREVEKKIQVGGYDKEFSEKMKKEKEEERKASEALSKTMAKVRMPLFCPECQNIMNKRLDKKFWWKQSRCFDCVVKEEHQHRLNGTFEEYENKKIKANALSYLKDQEQQFDEWKKLVSKGGESMILEDGSKETWKQSEKESKALIERMQKEFDDFKDNLLSQINSK